MIKAHIYMDNVLVVNWRLDHCPRKGDTLRIKDGVYAEVTEVVWCLDEPHADAQRVNIRSKKLEE